MVDAVGLFDNGSLDLGLREEFKNTLRIFTDIPKERTPNKVCSQNVGRLDISRVTN